MIEIRPFQPADWDALLDLANQAVPFAEQGNLNWLARCKAFDEMSRFRRHCIAVRDGRAVGYGCLEQQGDDPAWLRVYVVCALRELEGEVGARLYDRLLALARESGAQLWAQEYQADETARRFFSARGFVETRRFTLPGELPMVVYQLERAGAEGGGT